jgi:hypothetical protein
VNRLLLFTAGWLALACSSVVVANPAKDCVDSKGDGGACVEVAEFDLPRTQAKVATPETWSRPSTLVAAGSTASDATWRGDQQREPADLLTEHWDNHYAYDARNRQPEANGQPALEHTLGLTPVERLGDVPSSADPWLLAPLLLGLMAFYYRSTRRRAH